MKPDNAGTIFNSQVDVVLQAARMSGADQIQVSSFKINSSSFRFLTHIVEGKDHSVAEAAIVAFELASGGQQRLCEKEAAIAVTLEQLEEAVNHAKAITQSHAPDVSFLSKRSTLLPGN